MIVDCISDLHGFQPTLEGGDLLICAGDCTDRDRVQDWMEFFEWMKAQPYKHKILVGGNHDGFLERSISSQEGRELLGDEFEETGIEYLCDSGARVEGIQIWGSPWTPRFYNWHFMLTRGERLRQKWALIPDDTQILVTHGPAYGTRDRNAQGIYCGCKDLSNRLMELKNLKLHVFGHIHESYGQNHAYYTMENASSPEQFVEFMMDDSKSTPGGYLSVNCSIMDEVYDPVNKPIRVIL